MKHLIRIGCFAVWLSQVSFSASAQEGVTTVGMQYKPIIPSSLFNSGPDKFQDDNWNVDIRPAYGHTYGMVIRHGITKRWSIEGGITYTVRRFSIDASFNDTTFSDADFKLIGYEFPFSGLVYVKLGERLYMNNSLGVSIDMFPSDIYTGDYHFDHFGIRRSWLQAAVIGNVGFEFRTEKSGYFYLGGSLHRPFSTIAKSILRFHTQPTTLDGETGLELSGNYLTVDLRYFFHEDPEKKARRRKGISTD